MQCTVKFLIETNPESIRADRGVFGFLQVDETDVSRSLKSVCRSMAAQRHVTVIPCHVRANLSLTEGARIAVISSAPCNQIFLVKMVYKAICQAAMSTGKLPCSDGLIVIQGPHPMILQTDIYSRPPSI